MNPFFRFSASALFVFAASQMPPAALGQTAPQPAAKVAKAGDEISGGSVERGKYIVENVAQCGRCHTPGGDGGRPDHSMWLQGAPIRQPNADWAVQAPRIAGRPPGTDEQVVMLLTTGISRTGAPARPPMPQFKMQRADAEAVLAYLKSLKR